MSDFQGIAEPYIQLWNAREHHAPSATLRQWSSRSRGTPACRHRGTLQPGRTGSLESHANLQDIGPLHLSSNKPS
jgi:hypothetical protein